MSTYDAKQAFTEGFKQEILAPLAEVGFFKYKTRRVARVTEGAILQFITLRNDIRGTPRFIADITLRPLFTPISHLPGLLATPGAPLYLFSPKLDTRGAAWSSYETQEELEESLVIAKKSLSALALPWFERTSSASGILEEYATRTQPHISWGHGFEHYELGMVCMAAGEYEQAIDHLLAARASAEGIGIEKAQEALDIMEQGLQAVAKFLSDTIRTNIDGLKLPKRQLPKHLR